MDLLRERAHFCTARQKVYHWAAEPKEFLELLFGFLDMDSCLHVSHYQVHACSQHQKIRERMLPEGHFTPENFVHF